MVFLLVGLLPILVAFMPQSELTEYGRNSEVRGTHCKYHSDMGDKQVLHKFSTNNHTSFNSDLIIEHTNCATLLKKKMYSSSSNNAGDDHHLRSMIVKMRFFEGDVIVSYCSVTASISKSLLMARVGKLSALSINTRI